MKQSPKGLSTVLYLQSLDRMRGIATSLEIRNNAGRKGNSFRVYIKELLDKNYINVVGSSWPKKYQISELGTKFLKENETYFL